LRATDGLAHQRSQSKQNSLSCLSVLYRSCQFAGGAAGFTASEMVGKKSKADLGLYSGCGLSTVECSVESLLWIPAYSPQQRQAAAAAAAALTASAATLAVGSSLACGLTAVNSAGVGGVGICVPGGQQSSSGPQYGAGSIQAVSSSCSLLSDASLANLQAVQQQRQQQQQQQQQQQSQQGTVLLNPAPRPAAAPQARTAEFTSSSRGSSSGDNSPRSDGSPQRQDQQQTAAAAGAGEGGDEEEEPDALLLLASGGDGGVLVWHVDRLAQVSQLCELPGEMVVPACSCCLPYYDRSSESLQYAQKIARNSYIAQQQTRAGFVCAKFSCNPERHEPNASNNASDLNPGFLTPVISQNP
jgi:hypothetical protein